MNAANDYRQFAEECRRSARQATTEAERKTFLDMARAWTQAAAKVNGLPIDTEPPEGASTGPSQ